MQRLVILALVMAASGSGPALAQKEPLSLGGDLFVSGSAVETSAPSARDMFASGFSIELSGLVEADLHAAGFDVELEGAVGGDLYAAGFSVDVASPVGQDLTVSAGSLHLSEASSVGGNARVMAGTAKLEAPISGSLFAMAGSLEVNGSIAGDAHISAGHISFGPQARVAGILTYASTEPIIVPPSVAPADRVRFERLRPGGMWENMNDQMGWPFDRFWPSFLAFAAFFVIAIAFLLTIAAVVRAFAPRVADQLRIEALRHPFQAILLGALGLAMLVGLVPVSALTLVGIPLIPIVILAIILTWICGYLLGVYALAWRLADAFSSAPATLTGELVLLAAGLILFAVLNFVPVLGWLVNLLAIFLGLGALMQRAARLVSRRDAPAQPPLEASGATLP
jgi:hypothetical protein